MKKIISFLLLAAMLVGCMVPAVIVSAADAVLTAESVEKLQGTSTEVALGLSIENNPGLSALSFVVYYDKTQLAQGSSDAFDGALASAADSVVNSEVVGTNNKVKNYIPEEARSASKAFSVELYGAYNEETEATDAIVGDGVLVYIPLNILAEDFGDYTYNVVVVEAYDEEGNEVALEGTSGTVTLAADPYIGIYDEFTVFLAPDAEDISVGTSTLDVDVRFDQNPGVWATRVYIVYPESLTLSDGAAAKIDNNTGIFLSNSDLITGLPDLALDDERQVQGFTDLMKADPSIVREGYHSTTIYFERQDSFEDVYTGNGVLCSLHFDVAADVEVGDVLDIKIYYGDADFLFADTDESGQPVFIKYEPTVYGAEFTVVCEHAFTTNDHKDATCGEAGYDKVVCDDCGATISETEIPATGVHTPGEPVEVDPTCGADGSITVSCTDCGIVISEDVIPATGEHTPGAAPTCQAAQICTVCGEGLAAPIDHIEGTPVVTNPTCDEDGQEVYSCTMCGEVLRTEVLEATGHLYLQPQNSIITPPTCTEDGYTTRYCDVCNEPKITDPVPAWGHDKDGDVVIVESTCLVAGTKTTYCDTCGEVSEVEELPLADHSLEVVEGVDAYCHTDGFVTFWVCSECLEVFFDEEGTQVVENLEDLIIEAENDLVYVPGAEACHVPGIQEYWYCPECDCVYEDAEGLILTNRKNLEIAPDCELVHMEKVEACHANGTEEYWFCPECEAVYADEAGTMLTNRMNLTIPADAEAKHVAAVAATCTTNGMAEYWYCEECDTHFSDAECKYNVAYLSLTIPATGHNYVNGVCSVCGEGEQDDNRAPVTGDNMMFIVVALAVVLVAGTAVVVIRRKRRAN